ncbi:MAG: hypothetical protein PGN13_09545, partial [Patulibacter minatonensis]
MSIVVSRNRSSVAVWIVSRSRWRSGSADDDGDRAAELERRLGDGLAGIVEGGDLLGEAAQRV